MIQPFNLKNPIIGLKVFLFSILIFFVGCNAIHQEPNVEPDENFAKLIDTSKRYPFRWKNDLFASKIDRAFHQIARPSIMDSINYLQYEFVCALDIDNDYAKAFTITQKIHRIIEQNNLTSRLHNIFSLVHFWQGDILFKKGEYAQAFRTYYKGKRIAEKYHDDVSLSEYNYYLARMLFRQEKFENSIFYFNECLQLLFKNQIQFVRRYRLQEVLSNLGLCHSKLKKYDSARYYFQQAINYTNSKLNPENSYHKQLQEAAVAVITGNLGSVHEALGFDTLAESNYKVSIYLNQINSREYRDAVITSLKLGKLYYRNNERTKLSHILNNVRLMLDSLNDISSEQQWYFLKAKFYEKIEPQTALFYLLKSNQLRDSIDTKEHQIKAQDINANIDNIENEEKINELENDKQHNKYLLIIAIILISSVAIFTTGLLLYYKRLKRFYLQYRIQAQKIAHQKDELQHAVKNYEKSNKEKDKILHVVAHDLRSPINSIYGIADFMSQDPKATAEQKESLEMIKQASRNSLDLSNEILESAILLQSAELVFTPINVVDLVNNCVGFMRFKASEKKQILVFQQPKEQITIHADHDKIQRVVNNLLTNAIKFSPAEKQILINLKLAANGIQLSVQDEGIGVPKSIQDKIFNIFTEAKRDGTNGEKAFGLGLSISKQIVLSHKGKIWLESEEGKGATFYVFLPFNPI